MKKVLVIGGGPAGCMAAIAASEGGNRVILLEKNEKLGKKLFITGKGRCNLTNASDMKTVMENVVSNPKFLYSAFREFSNEDIISFMEEAGCAVKVERGNRVFPVSDHSSDVIRALEKRLTEAKVTVRLRCEVKKLIIEEGSCSGVLLRSGERLSAEEVIVATGGMSYPSTGSTGDGYAWAAASGHEVTERVPSLVPLECAGKKVCASMMGLSLKNIEASVYDGEKLITREFGEMLFTHFGVSGPVILSASSFASRLLAQGKSLRLCIDLKPALEEKKLDERLLRDFSENRNKDFRNSLSGLLPSGIIDEVIRQSGINPFRKVNSITKEERAALIRALKTLTFILTKSRGMDEAIITQGGISVKDINPKTMESKKIQHLRFAGEVLDVDAMTGGFNLQIAWSTGHAAGGSI